MALIRRRLLHGELAVFFWYTMMSTVLTAISYGLWLNQANNLPVINLNTMAELVLLTLLYATALEKTARWIVLITGSATFVYGIINLAENGFMHFDGRTKAAESMLIFIFTILYFRKLLLLPDKKPLRILPMFWINSGLLIYFAAGLFLFALGNSIIRMPNSISRLIWGMDMLVSLFAYAFIFTGLWKTRTT